jgi:hypothetical protein
MQAEMRVKEWQKHGRAIGVKNANKKELHQRRRKEVTLLFLLLLLLVVVGDWAQLMKQQMAMPMVKEEVGGVVVNRRLLHPQWQQQQQRLQQQQQQQLQPQHEHARELQSSRPMRGRQLHSPASAKFSQHGMGIQMIQIGEPT